MQKGLHTFKGLPHRIIELVVGEELVCWLPDGEVTSIACDPDRLAASRYFNKAYRDVDGADIALFNSPSFHINQGAKP